MLGFEPISSVSLHHKSWSGGVESFVLLNPLPPICSVVFNNSEDPNCLVVSIAESTSQLKIFPVALQELQCGHFMHSHCFAKYTQYNYTCPTCSKSLGDMSVYFRMVDSLVAMDRITLPPAYRDRKQVPFPHPPDIFLSYLSAWSSPVLMNHLIMSARSAKLRGPRRSFSSAPLIITCTLMSHLPHKPKYAFAM